MIHRLPIPRRTWVGLAVAVVSLVVAIPASPVAASDDGHVTVMTRNLYLGSDLTNLLLAGDQAAFIEAVTKDWNNVVATDFPRRAKALATEIQLTRPDVIGLQEVSLFREQLVSDIILEGDLTPNATDEVYDFLGLLDAELERRGLHYEAVSLVTNGDLEAPRLNAASPIGFTDVRLTDRDVILVRSALKNRFSNKQNGHYRDQFTVDSAGGRLTFTRGWASVDYALTSERSVRIFNTHLETSAAAPVQVLQGNEAADLISASPYPVIALGDFNSAADGSTTPTYGNLVARGLRDAWSAARPFHPGRTCCQGELLQTISEPTERIDLVLTTGPWRAELAVRTGQIPFRRSPPPIWASDHFGVFAILTLK